MMLPNAAMLLWSRAASSSIWAFSLDPGLIMRLSIGVAKFQDPASRFASSGLVSHPGACRIAYPLGAGCCSCLSQLNVPTIDHDHLAQARSHCQYCTCCHSCCSLYFPASSLPPTPTPCSRASIEPSRDFASGRVVSEMPSAS